MTDEDMPTIEVAIRAKLMAAFAPTRLEVVNESHLHHGHAGSPGSGQSHFRVVLASAALDGLTRVAQHRRINAVLVDEFARGLHALAIAVEES